MPDGRLKIKSLDETNNFCLQETRAVQNDLAITVNGDRIFSFCVDNRFP
jgi:hypothetical protein